MLTNDTTDYLPGGCEQNQNYVRLVVPCMLGNTSNVTLREQCFGYGMTLFPQGNIGCLAMHTGHHLYIVVNDHVEIGHMQLYLRVMSSTNSMGVGPYGRNISHH